MMSARGKNPIPSILLGSVSASVIRRATTNVLLMRYPADKGTGEKPCAGIFSRLLLPTDFSKPAGNAVALAQELPAVGEILLFHVVDKDESEKEILEYVQAAKEKLEKLRVEFVRAGFNAISRVTVGYPPDEIIATADNNDISIIVMSPYGEGWVRDLKALFVGSTTSAVIRRAYRPRSSLSKAKNGVRAVSWYPLNGNNRCVMKIHLFSGFVNISLSFCPVW
jgi:nucleotide-binding universal stress UspA family protein